MSAVSLVVNDKSAGRVAPQTEIRIREAVARLGYRVNSTASALARGETNAIGFVSPDPTNPFFSMVLEGLASELDDQFALTLLVPSHGTDYGRATLKRALTGDFAGLVISSPGRDLLDGFAPTCPTILLDAEGPQEGIPSIDLDIGPAMRDLAVHLVGLGHTRVAYVGVSRDKASLQHRRLALADALDAAGALLVPDDLVLDTIAITTADRSFPTAWRSWERNGVTAVVCGDELFAYGVLSACARIGLDVPERLAVVGFNDLPYSAMTDPPLTTVDLSARELGVGAARSLQHYIRTGRAPATRRLTASLVVRESTSGYQTLTGVRAAAR